MTTKHGRAVYFNHDAMRLYREGKTITEVANTFGVCHTTIRRWARVSGIESRKPGRPRGLRKREDVMRDTEIAELLAAGMTQSAIAARLNISRQRVSQLIHANNLKSSPPRAGCPDPKGIAPTS